MARIIILFLLFFPILSYQFINAQSFEENKEKVYLLDTFTTPQWKSYIDEGNNMNEVLYLEEKEAYTVFHLFAHNFGYYCTDDRKQMIYQVVKNTKEPLINPLFFLNDACWERKKDIMEYYTLLVEHGHKLSEPDFKKVYESYYGFEGAKIKDIDYINIENKTCLIYATEFNYTSIAKKIINKTKKINHCDNKGKTALFYACENNNTSLIQLLIAKGIDSKQKDKTGKTALDYCKNKATKKVLKKAIASK